VPGWSGVGQVDGDLRVLDTTGRAGVLALDSDRAHAFFEVSGLVDHQDPVGVTEGVDDVVPQVISDTVFVPCRAGKEVLHPVRVLVTGVFSDRPAVLSWQVRHQPGDERA